MEGATLGTAQGVELIIGVSTDLEGDVVVGCLMDGATVGMLSGHALSPLFVGVLDGLGNDFLFVGCSGTPISLLRCGFLV